MSRVWQTAGTVDNLIQQLKEIKQSKDETLIKQFQNLKLKKINENIKLKKNMTDGLVKHDKPMLFRTTNEFFDKESHKNS